MEFWLSRDRNPSRAIEIWREAFDKGRYSGFSRTIVMDEVEKPFDTSSLSDMPLWGHLEALRSALVKCLIAIVAGFSGSYYFSEKLIIFLEQPLLRVLPEGQKHLYFTGVADKFLISVKVSFYAGLVLALPMILRQIWVFVSPALKPKEKRFAGPFLVLGTFAFFGGMAFGYYLVIPSGYEFLISYGSGNDRPIISLVEYFGMTTQLLLVTGSIFELPVILMLLAKIGVIHPQLLSKYRPQAYLGLTVLAAFLTPTPDAFTMGLVLVPLFLLYELSVQLTKWVFGSAVV